MINIRYKERKKVVCLFNSFVSISGGDTRFIEIFKRISNFDKVIVTPLKGKRICEQNKLEANFILTTKELHIDNVLFTYFMRFFRTLLLKVEIGDKDVIYSTSDFLLDTLPAFFWKMRNKNIKWVFCIFLINPTLFRDYSKVFAQNSGFSMPNLRKVLFFLSQQLTLLIGKRWADQILVLNKMDREYLIKQRGIAESMVSVVDGGVDYTHILTLKTKPKKVYAGIFLARFHPQKGIFDLIKIWKLVCDKKPAAKLCIIGSGSSQLVEEVKTFIKENDLSRNIEVVGLKLGDEKFSLLKSSRVFLCPSYYESFAIVIAEAMACGLPVVAYNLPIYGDIYGKTILSVPLGDVNQFANVVVSLLDDPCLSHNFGLEGQCFVKKYDWVEIAKRELELITNLQRKQNG